MICIAAGPGCPGFPATCRCPAGVREPSLAFSSHIPVRRAGGFKLEVQRLGYCAVLLVASARVNARAKV